MNKSPQGGAFEALRLVQHLVVPFYGIERDMLVPTPTENGPRRLENDAEHSWSVALIACTLAPTLDPDLDVGLVAQFAIAHDLVELHASDTSIWAPAEEIASKPAREAASLETLRHDYVSFPWLTGTIEAYESQSCAEALYVRAVDKFVAMCMRLLDEGEVFIAKGITRERFEETVLEHRKKAYLHEGVGKYYDAIIEVYRQHPEYFAAPAE
jgi:putative hydrolase of HD superfamily